MHAFGICHMRLNLSTFIRYGVMGYACIAPKSALLCGNCMRSAVRRHLGYAAGAKHGSAAQRLTSGALGTGTT